VLHAVNAYCPERGAGMHRTAARLKNATDGVFQLLTIGGGTCQPDPGT